MRRLRDHFLTLAFTALFLASLVGQAFVGHADFNQDQLAHHGDPVTLSTYIGSSSFWVDVTENWQSEYLQFTLFILLTVWLVQRGSPESKVPGAEGGGTDEQEHLGDHLLENSPPWAKAGGWRTWVYSNSLVLLMTTLWVGSWLAQAVTGRILYNAEQLDHHEAPLTLVQYVTSPDFWNRTLQNWQSEFLAIGSMVVFSIYLRQRGSPESKPVGCPHTATGVEAG
jgi:hypothetical protein